MAGIALRRPVGGWGARHRPTAIAPVLPQRLLLWVGASLLLVAVALNFYLFQVSIIATSAYQLQRLEQERQDWLARNQQLELELAKARSLRWVDYQASQRLGMVKGEEPIFLDLSDHQEARIPPAAQSHQQVRSAPEADDPESTEDSPEPGEANGPAAAPSQVATFAGNLLTIMVGALRG